MFFSPASRRSSKRSSHVSRKARRLPPAERVAASAIECLENRLLLTTITGNSGPVEYIDAAGNTIRIRLRGNIRAEFLALEVPDTSVDPPRTQFRVRDLLRTGGTETAGFDLFSIYIAQADLNSSISIAQVPATGQNRPMQPFSGSVGQFNIFNARTGERDDVSPDPASGSVLIGARTGDTFEGTTDEEDIAVLSVNLRERFGVRPASANGRLAAGVFTAPGVSIGQILIGGTVTGLVNITGSINLFYAGNIWTGDARGLFAESGPNIKNNFFVGGDARNIVSLGSIGTDALDDTNIERPDFKTGFDLRVDGRLGQLVTKDSYFGGTTVFNLPSFEGPGTAVQEIEVRDQPKTGSQSFFEGNPFPFDEQQARPSLGDNPIFNNDTRQTAQYVGTAHSANNNGDIVAEIRGELDGSVRTEDHVDYYAMGLLAGQTVQVQLTVDSPFAFETIGVFDPDGRLIATDNANSNSSTLGRAFRFTTDRPGIYHFAVAFQNDNNYNGVQDDPLANARSGVSPYTLLISRAADIGLGGIVAANSIGQHGTIDPNTFFPAQVFSIDLEEGDIGAIVSTGGGGGQNTSDSVIFSSAMPFTVKHGNLRAIEADSIGTIRVNEPVIAPDLKVPRGGVGLLRARGTAANQVLAVNLTFVTPVAGTFDPANAIGFDYQLVDARSTFAGNLLANRGIGIVRAANISTPATAPRLAANADNRGNDGFIDLIDVSGRLGTLTAGGPQITTGTGGNVRYIHVANPSLVFRDSFFGSGTQEQTLLNPAQSFRFTDDSGTSVKLNSFPVLPQTTDVNESGSMRVLTYGIRDKGGSVLVNVEVLPGVRVVQNPGGGGGQGDPGGGTGGGTTIQTVGRGLQIDTGSNGGTGGVEIGQIVLGTPGTDFIFNPLTRGFSAVLSGTTVNTDGTFTPGQGADVLLTGRRVVDIYDMRAVNPTAPTTLTGFGTINNRTGGEIVNLEASSVGFLEAQRVGIGLSKTKVAVQGVNVRTATDDLLPFLQQRSLIHITRDAQTIRSRGALGNIQVEGTIGTLTANSDGVNDTSVYEGISAPVFTGFHMINVNIGEGIAPSGSGNFAQSGLFANGVIANVRNQGVNSDIRGDIVASGSVRLPEVSANTTTRGAVRVAGIGEINLANGTIVDADILVTRFSDSLELPQPQILSGADDVLFESATPNIGRIIINGIGGIMGSLISANNIGPVEIQGGFGVINSSFTQQATSTFDGIDTDGYGVRLSIADGGAVIDHIVARGNGKLLNTLTYSPVVRQSELGTFDPMSGRSLSSATDLHTFLGTSRRNPRNSATSRSGTIEDSTFTGSRDLGVMQAFSILGRPDEIDEATLRPRMRISFAENVGSIITTQDLDGLDLTTGSASLIQAGRNMQNTVVNMSGVLKNLVALNNIKGSTTVNVLGGEGRIDSINTRRALFGTINASTRISRIFVGTDFGSPNVSSSNDIGMVLIQGSMLSGSRLRAADQIAQLVIGGDIDAGATVRARRLSTQRIDGQVFGDIIIQ